MSITKPWIVLKFGGTSVSTERNWGVIAAKIEELQKEGARPFVVCSALSGVSDLLQSVVDRACEGGHQSFVDEILSRHRDLGESLGVDGDQELEEFFHELDRLARGAELVGEVSPSLEARIMSLGELMSTRLGAAYLRKKGVDATWRDARKMMTSQSSDLVSLRQRFLSAICPFEDDPELRDSLSADVAVLTQGFIASDERGRTVLLGRGGSDTSASYFAARLGAQRLEIWTDVPGMFTANPRQIPEARLLKRLEYDEAQELATMGAKVLHPRCLPPVRTKGIPLHLRSTPSPEMEGTVIAADSGDDGARVKAISAKKGVTVISMDTLGMWQEVGFLADIFGIFKSQGLSIDLVATSEANVTVTLDPMANALEPEVLDRLLSELGKICAAEITGSCAVVSLVGRQIRSILSRLTPALKVFEEQQVYLVSQAASDLNLSFVVDEDQADRLVQKLHKLVFGEIEADRVFGASWTALIGAEEAPDFVEESWWASQSRELIALASKEEGPLYVYQKETLLRQARALKSMEAVDEVFFAIKANSHPEILALFEEEGLNFECVSPGELQRVRETFPNLEKGRTIFTPNFAPRREYETGFAQGAYVTLDNLYPLQAWPEVFEGKEVLLRVDPGHGKGHHRYVRTAGPKSKFGVSPDELSEVGKRAKELNLKIKGLHAHVGSGVREVGTWSKTALFLESCREYFPDVEILNLGGGLGVPERPGHRPLNLESVDEALLAIKAAHQDLKIWLEPGRFLVSEAGVLLAKVTQTKRKSHLQYVGIEAGMNTLIRPALYGAHHYIINLSRLDEAPGGAFEIVGPICESGDVLGHSRRLATPQEGDVLLIANAGAYGRVMSSEYNLRAPAREVLI